MDVIKSEDVKKELKDLVKNWSRLDERERNEMIQDVKTRIVQNNVTRSMKVIELCPVLRDPLTSDSSLFSQSYNVILNWKPDSLDETLLTNCLKFVGYSNLVGCADNSDLESQLINLIITKETSNETSLICGTTLAKLIVKSSPHPDVKFLELIGFYSEKDSFLLVCLIEGILNSGKPELILKRFDLVQKIYQICIRSCKKSSSHIFQSFQSLKVLLQRLKTISSHLQDISVEEQKCLTSFLSCKSEATQELVDLTDSNWENPVKGVLDILLDIFANLMDICQILDPENASQFYQHLLDENLRNLSWKMKSKYPVILVILPRLDMIQVFQSNPDFTEGLSQCLTSNHLASAGTNIYRAILSDISLSDWQKYFLQVLTDALTCFNSKLVQSNAKNHWLLPTISLVKGSSHTLKACLSKQNDDISLAALLQVLKVERTLGIEKELSGSNLDYTRSGLNHGNIDVKSAAFSVICNLKQRGSPPLEQETHLILHFIPQILIVDCTSFRQVLMSDLTLLLIRCRDHLVLKHRRKTLGERDEYLINFLDSLLKICINNCYPGANYQRLITCLDILNILNNCFFDYKDIGVNKGSGSNGNPEELVKFCQSRNQLNLLESKNFYVLLKCVQYYMGDVREKAVNLLKSFQPSNQEGEKIIDKAFELLCSPKFAECESGARLIELCQIWLANSGFRFNPDVIRNELIRNAVKSMPKAETLEQFLVELYSLFLCRSNQEFLKFSRECPMHGFLTALRFCSLQSADGEFLQKIQICLQKSQDIMLQKMSSTSGNASFEDMSLAIDELIDSDDKIVEISEDHQLILACAWLNLKECSLLSSQIVCKHDRILSIETVSTFGHLMISTLIKCRHKGAIEATNSAMKVYSSHLLNSPNPKLRAIPGQMLRDALNQVEVASASITRRSAGLPMLIQKIVSSEPRGKQRQLLQITIDRMIEIIKRDVGDFKETHDLPQSHALHIMKSLIHDSSLSNDIGQYLPAILVSTVTQFSSPVWSIRNAALQLFGSLVPRILGQKKVRNSDSEHNSLTVVEFFTRYREILPFLLDQLNLKKDATYTMVNPALVPLLSMLSRIAPGNTSQDKQIEDFMIKFKRAFFTHLRSCVINVRVLSAKSFVAFTTKREIQLELDQIFRYLDTVKNSNFQSGLLFCARNLVIRDENRTILGYVENMKRLSHSMCCANLVLLQDILKVVNVDHEIELFSKFRSYDPFLYRLKGEQEQLEGHGSFPRFSESPGQLIDFLGDSLENLSGTQISEANKIILKRSDFFPSNPEVTLDLLEFATHEKIRSERFGITARTSSLVSTAIAFNSMMLQADFEMFFKDESPYLSRFVEFTEDIKTYSSSEKVEIARLHSALSLLELEPIINYREIKSLPLLLQYGFVNLCNSALVLLVDEDFEVRESVTRFVDKLKIRNTRLDVWTGKSICASQALEKLVIFGMVEFSECLEWFEPIVDLFYRPWTENWTDLVQKSLSRQYLFESGEGVNVYAEQISLNIIYFKMLKVFMNENPGLLQKLNLKLENLSEKVIEFIEFCAHGSNQTLMPFHVAWTSLGYLTITRFFHLVQMIDEDHYKILLQKLNYFIMHH